MIDVTNNDAINDELLPCPFCGETPVWYCKGNVSEIGKKRTIVVKCPMCGTRQETSVLKLPTRFGAMEAITKWNLRMGGKSKEEKTMKAPDKIYIQPNAHDGWFEGVG